MLQSLTILSIFVSLIFAGAMAGLFYAYSVSVMWGLDGIDGAESVIAMRSINRRIQNPIFFTTFFLTPVAAIVSGMLLLMIGERPAAYLMFAAAAVYICGAFVPTVVVNVPMNNALEAAGKPDSVQAAALWTAYSPRWTAWNHVRTLSCFASLMLVGAALFARG